MCAFIITEHVSHVVACGSVCVCHSVCVCVCASVCAYGCRPLFEEINTTLLDFAGTAAARNLLLGFLYPFPISAVDFPFGNTTLVMANNATFIVTKTANTGPNQ